MFTASSPVRIAHNAIALGVVTGFVYDQMDRRTAENWLDAAG